MPSDAFLVALEHDLAIVQAQHLIWLTWFLAALHKYELDNSIRLAKNTFALKQND